MSTTSATIDLPSMQAKRLARQLRSLASDFRRMESNLIHTHQPMTDQSIRALENSFQLLAMKAGDAMISAYRAFALPDSVQTLIGECLSSLGGPSSRGGPEVTAGAKLFTALAGRAPVEVRESGKWSHYFHPDHQTVLVFYGSKAEPRAAACEWLADSIEYHAKQLKGDADSAASQSSDDSAFRPAREMLRGDFTRYDQLRAALKANAWIRRRPRQKRGFDIHAGDWSKFLAQREQHSEESDEPTAVVAQAIQNRRLEIDRKHGRR